MAFFFFFGGRPISLSLNTGLAPLLPRMGQYAPHIALFRYRSIRALGSAIAPNGAIRSAYRPISLSLNTGSGRPGVALRYTPRPNNPPLTLALNKSIG